MARTGPAGSPSGPATSTVRARAATGARARPARRGGSRPAPTRTSRPPGTGATRRASRRRATIDRPQRGQRHAPCPRSRAEGRCDRGTRRSGCTRWPAPRTAPVRASPRAGRPRSGANANSTPDTAWGPANPNHVGYASTTNVRPTASAKAGRACPARGPDLAPAHQRDDRQRPPHRAPDTSRGSRAK